jgi:hypothetical protein
MEDFDDNDSGDVFSVLTSILETDRMLYNSIRYFPEDTRATVLLQHQVNNSGMIALLRTSLAQPTSMVINLPYPDDLADVPVLATATQIADATTAGITVTDADCAICQDTVTMVTKINHCGHGFHDTCIQNWFTRSVRCPVCRWDIREE